MLLDILRGGADFTQILIGIISSLVVIFLTMPIHEFAHAFVANKLGDPTPRYSGRLSLNPFNHIDYIGALSIVLFGFGWAKPVGVNANYFKNPKLGMALTAFAGPIANILVAFVSVLLQGIFIFVVFAPYVAMFFSYIAVINLSLAVFNLIPVPPLDGSKLLAAILPDRLYWKLMQYERYLYFILIILIASGGLGLPVSTAVDGIYTLFANIVTFILG